MRSEILEYIGIDLAYILIGMLAIMFIMFILLIINMGKYSKLKKKYNAFMMGKDAKSLEEKINKEFSIIESVKKNMDKNTSDIVDIKKDLQKAFQKSSIVKYDAFKEMGGNMSYAYAMLDKDNNGFVINSMHSREGCYTYIKEIIKGESYIVLSEEEKEALKLAIGE
ncbi:Protein of unknown function [Acetitomaculum ruminis DSM 5522]|uniref:DUF4446 family protein n=1 Tax=Acetitomaculum ruminis DSM 5522 TaxID=1120918 RepID=A0A1I0ZAU3_9FIRM|nr:DUF4446 family protein [Acetitomaculum ruminis]SFB22651.1 Protein of unknown function [Acetitomaculum ruminis DSM 5522]